MGSVIMERADKYQGKLTAFVIVACAVAAIGGYAAGIAEGFTSTDIFLAKFFHGVFVDKLLTYENNYRKFNNQAIAAFTSSLYLAGLVSSLFAAPITRKYGRLPCMIYGGISFAIGATLGAAAVNLLMLISGRILLGFGIGLSYQAVPIYLSEMAPKQSRGGLNIMFQLAITLGTLTTNIVNHWTETHFLWQWRLSLGLAAVPGIIMIVGGILLPDTPNNLIERGLKDKGREVLEKIRGTSDIQAEYEAIHNARGIANSSGNPFRSILKKKNRPQLTMAICMPAFQILTGMNLILIYTPLLFERMQLGANPDITRNAALHSSALTGAVLATSTIVSIATVDSLGRRFLLISGGMLMTICQSVLAILFWIKSSTGKELDKSSATAALVIVCVFLAAYGWSWGPLTWTVPSEIFPLETRSAGQSIMVAVNLLFTALISQFLLYLLCYFKFGVFLLFAACAAKMTVFVCLFLPETKGVPIEEMVIVWRKHWFWRKVVPGETDSIGNDYTEETEPCVTLTSLAKLAVKFQPY